VWSTTNWPIVVVLAALAAFAGLVASRTARGRLGNGYSDAIATGVLVGLLVGAVPRLIGTASVLLARSLPALPPGEVRSLAASIGPLVIQNLAAALVIVVYLVTLRSPRRPRQFALALSTFALADAMAAAPSSLPAPLTLALASAVLLGHLCRGLALGGGLAMRGYGFRWLAAAALLGGLLGSLGAALARQLGFEQATTIAVPLLAAATGLLVQSIATILGPGLGPGSSVRQLPLPGFLAGLALTLVANRLVATSPL
jgi:hypothetical protein